MGIAVIVFMGIIALWAAWVAWTVSREGGVPPYQDGMCNQEPHQGRDCRQVAEHYPNWPFPKDKP